VKVDDMGALRLSGYEVSHVLHTSVATIVCKAVRLRDGERVVLKLPQADHPSLGEVARYRNQYELQAAMAGAGVVRTLGLEHIDHRPVLVSVDTD